MAKNRREYDCLLKLVIIGDSGVGKTSLVRMFREGKFKEKTSSRSTYGSGYTSRIISLDGECILTQVWDIPGRTTCRSLIRWFFIGASGVVLVYDVTDQRSFDDLDTRLEEAKSYLPGDIPILLLGNKCDKHGRRVVHYENGKEYADHRNIELFVETSAKEGTNVEWAFVSFIVDVKAKNICKCNKPHS